MNINNGLMTFDIKLDATVCKQLIDYFEETKKMSPSLIGDSSIDHEGSHRRLDNCLFLDEANAVLARQVNQILNDCCIVYTQQYSILSSIDASLKSIKQKLQKTPIGGGFHDWHAENTSVANSSRVLVWTIYLNDVEEGGETEFLYYTHREKAEQGKICFFPANYIATHRGNPPISNEKYILTGWYTLHE